MGAKPKPQSGVDSLTDQDLPLCTADAADVCHL